MNSIHEEVRKALNLLFSDDEEREGMSQKQAGSIVESETKKVEEDITKTLAD